MKLRLAANLCRVCINQLQKGAKDNGRVRFFPCGDKLDPDIIWLQTVEPNTPSSEVSDTRRHDGDALLGFDEREHRLHHGWFVLNPR